jgi:hypothetical protein
MEIEGWGLVATCWMKPWFEAGVIWYVTGEDGGRVMLAATG